MGKNQKICVICGTPFRYRGEGFLEYLGNHFDDDDLSVWAVFGQACRRYCVLITK